MRWYCVLVTSLFDTIICTMLQDTSTIVIMNLLNAHTGSQPQLSLNASKHHRTATTAVRYVKNFYSKRAGVSARAVCLNDLANYEYPDTQNHSLLRDRRSPPNDFCCDTTTKTKHLKVP